MKYSDQDEMYKYIRKQTSNCSYNFVSYLHLNMIWMQHIGSEQNNTKGKQSFLRHNHLIIITWPLQNKKSCLGFRSSEKQSHWVKADEVAEGFNPPSEPMRVKPAFSFSPQSRRRGWGLLMEQQCIVGVSPVRKQYCWWVAWWEAAVTPRTMEEMHICSCCVCHTCFIRVYASFIHPDSKSTDDGESRDEDLRVL